MGRDGQRAVIRLFAILLLGLGLSGCGVVPAPTQQDVSDVGGTTWKYRGAASAANCEITFNADGTYSLVRRLPGSALTNTGCWGLSGAYLYLAPFDLFSAKGKGAIERSKWVRWWFTDVSTNQVVLFGGDSSDPHQWSVLRRAGGEPALTTDKGKPTRPPRAAIGPAHSVTDDLARTIGFSLAAGLLVCVVLKFGLWVWSALPRARAARAERSSGPSLVSAVLPQIERLRANHLSGAAVAVPQTLVHKRLIAAAKRVVAHFTYFRRGANSDPDETPHRRA